MNDVISQIVNAGYCIGCGLCASSDNATFQMKFEQQGKYVPTFTYSAIHPGKGIPLCPFSNNCDNEDAISARLFKNHEGINHNQYLGHYLINYAGYVKKGDARDKGSSGGFGTWLLQKMLETNLISHVIHVKKNADENIKILFKYAISQDADSIQEGAKSKYYPVELSEVMKYVRNTPGKYALVGIPCFIKAVRLLAGQDPTIADRVKYTIGLVCGHLKTDRFAKFMAWQMGIEPRNLTEFDFRVKLDGTHASQYGVKAVGYTDGKKTIKQSPVNQLFGTNWGYGFFKIKACDYCDDMLAETADISIGDAWLPEYESDSKGTNILVIRNPELLKMIEENADELHLDTLTAERICASQAGGFRHRREGLAYRLYLKDKKGKWRPIKRVDASNNLSVKRKLIYERRMHIIEQCDIAYEKAIQANDFSVFVEQMRPILDKYNRLLGKPLWLRIVLKTKRAMKSLIFSRSLVGKP